jgi:hypothetical protein
LVLFLLPKCSIEEAEEVYIATKLQQKASACWTRRNMNPNRGSSFDDFLKAQGIYEEVMDSPKLKKAIRDLADSIQAEMREVFEAGWNAFVARHSSFLISHSIADTRTGLEQAWEKYWKSRKEK